MKKWICGILTLMMVFTSVCALADARMPENRGALTDDADVLSSELSNAIVEYTKAVKDETNVDVRVVVVHFLDGVDAQSYANSLFTKWELDDESVLLLCAAGEDSFAIAMGSKAESKLGKQNMDNLLYTSSEFSACIAQQQYDVGFAKYFVAFNDLLLKRYDEEVKLPKLIGQIAGGDSAQTNAGQSQNAAGGLWGQLANGVGFAPYSPGSWNQAYQGVQDNSNHYADYQQNDTSNGIGVGGWIILMILVGIIFSQSQPVRKARRNHRNNRVGKGCNPVGLIVSLFGLTSLFGLFRRR